MKIACALIVWHIIRCPMHFPIMVWKCACKHHTSVHTNTPPAIGRHNNTQTEPARDGSSSVLTSFTPALDTLHLARLSLLKTAIALIIYEGTSIENNSQFDEGSQWLFISQALAWKLHLQPQARENVSLTSFRAEVPSYRTLDVATISIQSLERRCLFLFLQCRQMHFNNKHFIQAISNSFIYHTQ